MESPSNVLYPSQALFQANLEPPVKLSTCTSVKSTYVITHDNFVNRSIPEVDRSLKPRGGPPIQNGLRKVVIPATMISDFVILAYSNTKNNVETCGILAGKLVPLPPLRRFEKISYVSCLLLVLRPTTSSGSLI